MIKNIIFVSLAKNQSDFYKKIGFFIGKKGIRVVHIVFHEGAVKELSDSKCEVYNPYKYNLPKNHDINLSEYCNENLNFLFQHEKEAYKLFSTSKLEKKFKKNIYAINKIFESLEISKNNDWAVIQELGGFLSVLSVYYVAKKYNIDNWFIEPSFYKKRFFMTVNSFKAPSLIPFDKPLSSKVKKIINDIIHENQIVIPSKDKKHYRSVLKKILDFYNMRRFVEKVFFRYFLRKQEEFRYVISHSFKHLKMFINSLILKLFYKRELNYDYIYFPMHVPADFALTLRSPAYLDQYSLIDYICRSVPLNYKLVIKEHPALIGAINPVKLYLLLRRHDNLIILTPQINNHEVIKNSKIIISVNSKAGAEAMLYKKNVIVLGDALYCDSPLALNLGNNNLSKLISFALNNKIDNKLIGNFFQSLWDSSNEGELYVISKENIKNFSISLLRILKIY